MKRVLSFATVSASLFVALVTLGGCEQQGFCWEGCEDNQKAGSGGTGNAAGKGGAPGGAAGGIAFGGNGGGVIVGGSGGLGGSGGKAGGGTCQDTKSDPNNCGQCGNVCTFPGAFGKCEAGVCKLDTCAPGRIDLDTDLKNGCEYVCVPSGAEVCDGKDNDCNGKTDEGIDLQTDPKNCGVCGVVCDLANATAACVKGACVVSACSAGFGDIDKLPSDGCEYKCPVNPPVKEICDDLDNDCDGEVNNGNPGGGVACDDSCPSGDCKGECAKGVTLCAGTSVVCVAGSGPKLEICDGKDNDCNGVVDNGFDTKIDPLNCGTCGTVCTGANAVGGCTDGKCVVAQCLPGFRDSDNKPENGCEYKCPQSPPGTEICNGVDDDCDGIVDNPDLIAPNKPADTFCNKTAGTPCEGATITCQGKLGWRCGYKDGAEVDTNGDLLGNETKCDGKDGNCNGQVDEPFSDLGTSCDNGKQGACRDAGTRACDPADASKTLCDFKVLPDAVPGAPFAKEECNAIDDDCNGDVDDGLVFDMVEIDNGTLHFFVDRFEASRPDATDKSGGLNEERACVREKVVPWVSANYAEANDACEAGGRRLCTAEELRVVCEGTGATKRIYPYGDSYEASTCNGLDNDGVVTGGVEIDDNELLLTGSSVQCKTDGTQVFDLAGNAAEWTSTKTGDTGGATPQDIHQLHGGSFLSPELGTRCAFDLARLSTNAIVDSVGFRCCRDF